MIPLLCLLCKRFGSGVMVNKNRTVLKFNANRPHVIVYRFKDMKYFELASSRLRRVNTVNHELYKGNENYTWFCRKDFPENVLG